MDIFTTEEPGDDFFKIEGDDPPPHDRIPEGADGEADHEPALAAEESDSLEEWDAGDDTGLPPPREWLLGNQFCRKFLSGLLAPGATGKSVSGKCRSQKAACDQLKLDPSYASRQLKKVHVATYLQQQTHVALARSQAPAAGTMLRLLDQAKSEHVQKDVAIHLLGINGHKPTADPATQVNISIRAGYVIDLRSDEEITAGKAIDVAPPTSGSDNRGSRRRTIDLCLQINSYCERTARLILSGKHMGSGMRQIGLTSATNGRAAIGAEGIYARGCQPRSHCVEAD